MKPILVTAALIFTQLTYAGPYSIQINNDTDLCPAVLKEVINNTNNFFNYKKSKLFNTVKWNVGGYKSTNGLDKRESRTAIEYIEFDINNDGENELLAKEMTWLSGMPGYKMYILDKNKYDFSKIPFIPRETIKNFNSILSIPPWPYADNNILSTNFFLLSYKDINYIAMADIYFSNKYSRSLIIAKYPKKISYIKMKHIKTIKLKVICEIRHKSDDEL